MNFLQELQGQMDVAQILVSRSVITLGKLLAAKRLIRTFFTFCVYNQLEFNMITQ